MSAPNIYLDYAASTPIAPEVAAVVEAWLDGTLPFANAASTHAEGFRANAAINEARDHLANLIGTRGGCIAFTSGATESNNLAIQGVARARAHRGMHLITMRTEHKAVLDTFRALEQSGFEVTWLSPDSDGLLDPAMLGDVLREDTQLVSIMHINNETGICQDIASLGQVCRNAGVLFHTDAAQSVGKIPLNLGELPVDLLSLTAHKFYGPQGVGALYVADPARTVVDPLVFGGGQERGIRPGTLPVFLTVAMGVAARVAQHRLAEDAARMAVLNERLWRGIGQIDGVVRNGSEAHCYPGILNVSVNGIEGESLRLALEPLCVASGSACNSTSGESSYVLRALGRSDQLAQSAVRFSFGRGTTEQEIDMAVDRYRDAIAHLRAMAPRGTGSA